MSLYHVYQLLLLQEECTKVFGISCFHVCKVSIFWFLLVIAICLGGFLPFMFWISPSIGSWRMSLPLEECFDVSLTGCFWCSYLQCCWRGGRSLVLLPMNLEQFLSFFVVLLCCKLEIWCSVSECLCILQFWKNVGPAAFVENKNGGTFSRWMEISSSCL